MTTVISNLFHGERVKLAVPRKEDIGLMLKWGEDADYLRNVDTEMAIPRNSEQLMSEGLPGSNEVYFRLRTIEEDRLVGFITIYGIEWNNRTGVLALGIGDAADRNKGYGTDALRLILRYAFHELNLDRVGLEVIEYNAGGIKAYERAGFLVEGRKRSMVYRDGKRFDIIVMGILRSEWEALQAK
ncbi:GNAT family protein [Planococcus sp. N028]|uniref:GNAT family protein n=1 Tax=Planococcus shixiaomingii TaxID=3058393 RepID=A0ABT8N353_9BACL|nr:GNAT family protein [Planococcus sp. N028]MDN7242324.1 GNAT family protein [Planococcus sp. N028]